MLDIGQVIGSPRRPQQVHACLLGGPIALAVITLQAGTDQIFPRILPPPLFGDDVVNGHRGIGGTTILAAMSVPFNNVFPRQEDSFSWTANVENEPDDRGIAPASKRFLK